METLIQELQRKIKSMQKGLQATTDRKIAAILTEAIARAEQTLANFQEVERILSGGKPNE
jgi:hypothetical protein